MHTTYNYILYIYLYQYQHECNDSWYSSVATRPQGSSGSQNRSLRMHQAETPP